MGRALSDRPDVELVVTALDREYERRGKPVVVLFLRPRSSICQSTIPSETQALPHREKHKSPGKMLGQSPNGKGLPKLEERMDAFARIPLDS